MNKRDFLKNVCLALLTVNFVDLDCSIIKDSNWRIKPVKCNYVDKLRGKTNAYIVYIDDFNFGNEKMD